jgi:phage terminase small subunit
LGEVCAFRGRAIPNPWLRVESEAQATVIKLASHFGLSPSARCALFASPNAPIPATPHIDQDIAESFFTEDDDSSSVN